MPEIYVTAADSEDHNMGLEMSLAPLNQSVMDNILAYFLTKGSSI